MNREHLWQSGLFPENVLQGSTTKAYGVFRMGRAVDGDVVKNQQAFARDVGVSRDQFVFTEQVHGNQVFVATKPVPQDRAEKADAVITRTPGLVLIIKTADCVPIFFYDFKTRAVGVAHGGWKGIAADVVGETINAMAKEFGTDPKHILISVGPSICAEHYDVSQAEDDRVRRFETRFGQDSGIIRRQNGKIAFDLPAACKEACLRKGVQPGHIELSGICTYEDPKLWASYRREGERLTHDIWSFILLQ